MPIKPDSREARNHAFQVRLTDAEFAHLTACADASQARTKSDYVRRLIMGETPPRRASRHHHELVRQLAKAGTNLNQLAKAANSGRIVEPTGLQAALDEFRQALELVTLGK